jgi:hypothetical protein
MNAKTDVYRSKISPGVAVGVVLGHSERGDGEEAQY